MKILYTAEFVYRYNRLPGDIKIKAKNREKIFRQDPFNSRLKTHKLQGQLNEFWAFSINFQYRIIFKFEKNDVVIFYSAGTHSIYF